MRWFVPLLFPAAIERGENKQKKQTLSALVISINEAVATQEYDLRGIASEMPVQVLRIDNREWLCGRLVYRNSLHCLPLETPIHGSMQFFCSLLRAAEDCAAIVHTFSMNRMPKR